MKKNRQQANFLSMFEKSKRLFSDRILNLPIEDSEEKPLKARKQKLKRDPEVGL